MYFTHTLILAICLSISNAFECPQPTGQFPDPTNPHNFYECANGEPYKFTCPAPLVYDALAVKCDYEAGNTTTVATTTQHTVITTANPATTQSTTTIAATTVTSTKSPFHCPQPSGQFVDPTNPHAFYECANGEAYRLFCPEPLVFDPTITNCNYAADNTSTVATTPPPVVTTQTPTTSAATGTAGTTVTPKRPVTTFKCPEESGHFVDPTDPHKFYECANGEAYEFTCPVPLVFDESIKNCNFAADNSTSAPVTPTTGGSTVTTLSTTTHGPNTNTAAVTTVTTVPPVTTAPPVTNAPGEETTRGRHTIPPIL